MFVLILSIVLGIVVIIAGGLLIARGLPDHGPSSPSKVIGGTITAIIGIVLTLLSFGWTEIGPGQVGVVVNLGKVDPNEISSGLNWRLPIVSSIHIMDTRVQSFQFGGNPQGDLNDPANQGVETFTKEQQTANIYGNVNYSIDPTWAAELYQTVGDDWFNKVVVNATLAEIKQDARLYTVDRITSARDELATGAQVRLQADVDQYHITINGIFINNIRLSNDYIGAVLKKQIAEQNIETAKSEADTARATAQGLADSRVTQAKGEGEAIEALAASQARANESINSSITDNLIRWQAIQKLNPNVNVMLVPADSNFILNLPNQ